MKTTIVIIIGILTFATSLPINSQTLSDEQITTIRKEVDSVFIRMIRYAENLDYDKFKNGVEDKYNAGFILNAKYYSTYSDLHSFVKLSAQGVNHQKLSAHTKKISVLTSDIVLLTTSGTSVVTLDDGREIGVNFFWTFVYEKIDNTWKVVQSHQSRLS